MAVSPGGLGSFSQRPASGCPRNTGCDGAAAFRLSPRWRSGRTTDGRCHQDRKARRQGFGLDASPSASVGKKRAISARRPSRRRIIVVSGLKVSTSPATSPIFQRVVSSSGAGRSSTASAEWMCGRVCLLQRRFTLPAGTGPGRQRDRCLPPAPLTDEADRRAQARSGLRCWPGVRSGFPPRPTKWRVSRV